MSLIPKTLLAAISYLFYRQLPGIAGENYLPKLLFTLAIGVISAKTSCRTNTSRVDTIIGFPHSNLATSSAMLPANVQKLPVNLQQLPTQMQNAGIRVEYTF